MRDGLFWRAIATLAIGAAAPLAAQESDISVEVIEENDGTRTLVHEVVVEAPVDRVWATLTTEEGWKMWGPKFAKFDLRLGGSIETGYHEGATPGDPMNIRHRILGFVPERMIVLKVEQAPARGPVNIETLAPMWGVYELEPLGESSTRLRISGLGYGTSKAHEQMIEFFKHGNIYSIELLRENLAASAE